MIACVLKKVMEKRDLTAEEAEGCMAEIMRGEADPVQAGALLTALSMKGESVDELTAFASVMRKVCRCLDAGCDVMDVVGTGGDNMNTFNISTVSSFVVAAAGVKVAKHGNRGVSSKCGAADVLEALGCNLQTDGARTLQILHECGFTFLFAPLYHQSMKYVAPVRKALGVRTVFNLLGPLASPVGAQYELLGVCSPDLVEPMAQALSRLGVKRAMVVCGRDGLDEVTVTDNTVVAEINGSQINSFLFSPRQFGLQSCSAEQLRGGDPACNAQIALDILGGKERGAKRDIVLANAAVCLYMVKDGMTLRACVEQCAALIDNGRALQVLENYRRLSNEKE